MAFPLKALPKYASRVMDQLTSDLGDPYEDGTLSHRRVETSGGAFMAVIVERVGSDIFSIAHYGEQNGDLMCDPEMTFWRREEGGEHLWYAISFRNDYAGYQSFSVEKKGHSDFTYRRGMQRDQTMFAKTWMKNIKAQQDLKSIQPPEPIRRRA